MSLELGKKRAEELGLHLYRAQDYRTDQPRATRQSPSRGEAMTVLLWEVGKYFQYIVLYDGENTYWTEEMKPSGGKVILDQICPLTHGRYTLIGEL
jgi:hypothetical protein